MKTKTKKSGKKTSRGRVVTKRALAGKLRSSSASPSTAGIITSLRDKYGVSQTLLVRLSGYSPRSIVSWGKGTKATKPAKVKFVELGRLFEALADLTQNRGEVVAWLQEPNEAFD